MKLQELKEKVFSKQPEKNTDYRFKIYGKVQTALKACKLFLIQRIVKKIKDLKKDKQTLSPEQEESLTLLDGQLKNAKALSSDDLKVLAFFIFKWDFHLMIKSNQDKEGLIQAQFQRMLDKVKLDWEGLTQDFLQNPHNARLLQFYTAIKGLKKYKEIGEFKNKMIGDVQKKIAKNKDRKKKIKNKTIMSKKEKEEKEQGLDMEVEGEGDDALQKELKQFMKASKKEIEEEDKKQKEEKKQKKFKKEFSSNKYKKDQYDNYENQKFQKKDFSKQGKGGGQGQNKGFQQNKPQPKAKEENIHPSWAAALERKAQQQSVQFQGQKKKLC